MFNTRFELPDKKLLLGKENVQIQYIIIHQEARNTRFTVKLDRVQYRTYKKQRACLLSFKFLFFRPRTINTHLRLARITFQFCRVATLPVYGYQEDDDESDEDNINNSNVPCIICLLPEQIYGEPESETREATTSGKLSISRLALSPAVGCIEISRVSQATRFLKQRMSIAARLRNK